MDSFANEALQLIYQRKYLALKRRCEEVQQANEKLVNRIYNVKKIIKRYKKERSVLMQRLDQLGDDYQNALVPAFWEEGAGEDDTEEDEQETSLAVASIMDIKQEPGSQSQPVLSSPSGAAATGSGSTRKVKKEKRPANAYLIYCSTQRKAAQEKYLQIHGEEASRTELTKTLAHEWRELSLEEKRVYHEIAEAKKKMAAGTSAMTSSPESNMAAAHSNEVVYSTAIAHNAVAMDNSLGVVMDAGEFVQLEVKQEPDSKEFL